jgi:hypothetical protein
MTNLMVAFQNFAKAPIKVDTLYDLFSKFLQIRDKV